MQAQSVGSAEEFEVKQARIAMVAEDAMIGSANHTERKSLQDDFAGDIASDLSGSGFCFVDHAGGKCIWADGRTARMRNFR